VLWDLYESEPALQEELSEFVPLMMHSNPSNIIATIDKYPISKMSDLKGLKFRASAGAASDLLLAWGATPMQMAPGDIFQAVEKGTVEGYIFDLSGITSFSLQEVTANYTDMPVYLGPYYLLMNRNSFDALPEDLQQIILDSSDRETSLEMAYVYEADERRSRDVIQSAGGNFVAVAWTVAAVTLCRSTTMVVTGTDDGCLVIGEFWRRLTVWFIWMPCVGFDSVRNENTLSVFEAHLQENMLKGEFTPALNSRLFSSSAGIGTLSSFTRNPCPAVKNSSPLLSTCVCKALRLHLPSRAPPARITSCARRSCEAAIPGGSTLLGLLGQQWDKLPTSDDWKIV
jgi:hypothetical protein